MLFFLNRRLYFLIALLLSVFLIITPLIFIVLRIFTYSGNSDLYINYNIIFEYVQGSLLLCVYTTILSLLIAIPNAWIVSRYDIRFEQFFKFALILPLLIPSYILGFIYSDFFSYKGLYYNFIELIGLSPQKYFFQLKNIFGASFILGLSLYPYIYISTLNAFEKLNGQFIEVAKSFAYNDRQIFFKIILPLSRPSIVAGASLLIMEVFSTFGLTTFFGIPTFTTGIMKFWNNYSDISISLILSLILLLFILSLFTIEKLTRKNQNLNTSDLSLRPFVKKQAKFKHYVIMLIPILFGFIIPVFKLISWNSYSKISMFSSKIIPFIFNTFTLSLISSILIILWAWFLSITILNLHSRYHPMTQLINIGYALPGSIIALGLLLGLTSIDHFINYIFQNMIEHPRLFLTGSLFTIIFAYSIRYLSVAFNPIWSIFEKVGIQYNEAALNLGYTPLQTSYHIHYKLLKNIFPAIFILVFLDIIKELPISFMLKPFNFNTLATKAYEAAHDERLQDSAGPALIIILIGALVILSWELFFHLKIKKLQNFK